MRCFALALSLVLAAACGKSSDATGPNVNLARGSMSAKIDGTAWQATLSVTASNNGSIVGAAGTDAAQTIAFALAARLPGSYQIGLPNAANAELTTTAGAVWSAAGNIGSGTITITSLTATRVAGTFTFTLVKSGVGGGNKSVTDGKFDIAF